MIWRPALRRAREEIRAGVYCSFHSSSKSLAEALRDEAISARYVRVVDAESGSLSPKVERVQTLLKRMDRTRYWLVQVKAGKLDQEAAEDSASNAQGGKSKTPWLQPRPDEKRQAERRREHLESEMPVEDLAIVKMIDKKEAYNRLKEKKMERKQSGQRTSSSLSGNAAHKEVDLTWNSTIHDVEHKLKTLITHFKKKGPGAKGKVDIKAKSGKGRFGGVNIEQKNEMLGKMEDFLCNWEQGEGGGGGGNEGDVPQENLFHARRQGEIEWRAEGTHATIRIEVVKGRKPKSST